MRTCRGCTVFEKSWNPRTQGHSHSSQSRRWWQYEQGTYWSSSIFSILTSNFDSSIFFIFWNPIRIDRRIIAIFFSKCKLSNLHSKTKSMIFYFYYSRILMVLTPKRGQGLLILRRWKRILGKSQNINCSIKIWLKLIW